MNNIPQSIFPDDKIFEEIPYVYCYSHGEAERIVQNIKDHFKDKVEIEIVIDKEWYKCFIDENGKDIVSVKCNNGNLSYNSLLIHGKLAKSKLWYISKFKFDIYMKKINSRFNGNFVYNEKYDTLSLSINDISGYNDIFYFAVDFINYFKQIEPKFRNITIRCTNKDEIMKMTNGE